MYIAVCIVWRESTVYVARIEPLQVYCVWWNILSSGNSVVSCNEMGEAQ